MDTDNKLTSKTRMAIGGLMIVIAVLAVMLIKNAAEPVPTGVSIRRPPSNPAFDPDTKVTALQRLKWSERLDGNASISKQTLHPSRYRTGWLRKLILRNKPIISKLLCTMMLSGE